MRKPEQASWNSSRMNHYKQQGWWGEKRWAGSPGAVLGKSPGPPRATESELGIRETEAGVGR